MTACHFIDCYQRFGRGWCFHLRGRRMSWVWKKWYWYGRSMTRLWCRVVWSLSLWNGVNNIGLQFTAKSLGLQLFPVCLYVSQDQAPCFHFQNTFCVFMTYLVSILFSWTSSVLLLRNKSIFCLSFYVVIINFFFLDAFPPFYIITTLLFSWTLFAPLC